MAVAEGTALLAAEGRACRPHSPWLVGAQLLQRHSPHSDETIPPVTFRHERHSDTLEADPDAMVRRTAYSRVSTAEVG
jgi:hypothetical protein